MFSSLLIYVYIENIIYTLTAKSIFINKSLLYKIQLKLINIKYFTGKTNKSVIQRINFIFFSHKDGYIKRKNNK